ncbi:MULTISPECIES: low molecular weight protein-tyrosine-phosphatase [Mesorhizobium]|uniref:protein-tyrosine-phosphatase n=2 Tax=Mesorhizobium TaxID=68287 RepID=A0A1A5JTJ6_RHILI|nr:MULTISPECIES: low molecular weight protein-tyrosine-phosphatase [Mesorhizobium]MBE1710477.1 low molecular weight phosphotyrosine protein phosphatase [Mesorhizobium japonicum]MBE1712375.1 low molecular weight phosphotyrosine protein phosphatase [Mesorhizobium japonicum]MUT22755.1 low molecular weight phosphotyrosine protein phosphatase [Mesorhizobium japonicum]MUT29206.1 low molecular weight phosphotyrosine protein phosphatase [Mesorhizobium japonicum]OBP74749.1 protein tyrosine phosphatase 
MSIKPINSILFVCLGNICRSPLAEGVFRTVWAERGQGRHMLLDSAATSGWEVGSAPDPRSIAVAMRHGIDISGQRARKVLREDFSRFDLILGMDRSNVADLRALAPARDRVHLFLEFAHGQARDVPDPYYDGPEAFAEVYRMIREASEALATRLAARVSLPDSGQASSTI